MTTSNDFLDRVSMKPGSARAVVDVTLTVETATWGPDCTIAQAVKQAVDCARVKITNVLRNDPAIKIANARFVRVVCDAEQK